METYKKFGFDKPLFLTTLVLVFFGLIMVFSSSAVQSNEQFGHPFYFLINQAIGAVAGIILILVIVSMKPAFYQNVLFIYGLLILTLVLLALCFVMPEVNGTNRSIHLLSFRFQPSSLAKLSLVLFMASYLSRKKEKLDQFKTLIFPAAVLFIFILLIIKEPDYSTSLFIFVIGTAMLFIGGIRIDKLFIVGLISLVLFAFYLFQANYRIDRWNSYLSPSNDLLGSGFHAYQSKLAVGSGGIMGVSIAQSTQKLFFLPCAHTDYIYAIIGEELGLIGTMMVLILFGVILWRGILISRRAPDQFGRLVAAGLSIAIFAQALLNISIVLGLLPATGLTLPFFSYGRSSLLYILVSVGILLHISQRKKVYKRK
ncbi:MAG: putative lipid II flippase FtsW [Candidatus Aminicenantes bacterium]|nr:putative lipid II flippase FtsW [Candidatus Aminicenantes bacterium]